jgi:hypothetical protein
MEQLLAYYKVPVDKQVGVVLQYVLICYLAYDHKMYMITTESISKLISLFKNILISWDILYLGH